MALGRAETTIATLTLLALLVTAPSAPAHGRLDRSFGTQGRTLSPVPAPTAMEANGQVKFGMAEGPGGEIYVYDGEVIAAYSPRGVPDRRFGEGGYLVAAAEVRYVPLALGAQTRPGFSIGGVAVDSRGRIVVAGTSRVAIPGVSGEGSLATVRRYLPDGSLDPSFGAGGAITGNLGLPLLLNWTPFRGSPYPVQPQMKVAGLAIDSQDRPVVTGSAQTVGGGCDLIGGPESEGFVARLTSAGALDAGFNGSGSILIRGYIGEAQHPVLRSHGGVLVTVPSNRCRSPHQQALAALASNGHLDPAFGAGGLSSVAFGAMAGLALDSRGRTLALGEPMSEEQYGEGEGPFTKLARFGASGASERAFGKHGSVIVPFDGDPEALGVDARGRPLLAGWTLTDSSRPVRGFSIERTTRAGRVDRAFGHHGIATVGFGHGTSAEADAVLVDRRGRIVLSGLVSGARGRQSGTSFGLVRYLPSPGHRKEIHGKAH